MVSRIEQIDAREKIVELGGARLEASEGRAFEELWRSDLRGDVGRVRPSALCPSPLCSAPENLPYRIAIEFEETQATGAHHPSRAEKPRGDAFPVAGQDTGRVIHTKKQFRLGAGGITVCQGFEEGPPGMSLDRNDPQTPRRPVKALLHLDAFAPTIIRVFALGSLGGTKPILKIVGEVIPPRVGR